ncbi:MAG: Crp/Fnr family transcriptional regulator [Rhizobiales bacterium]|nr:Crp/Fnr family transcriptional regulator [Hyphomicrobiales bacterium]
MKRVTAPDAWAGAADCMNCAIRHSVLFAGLQAEDFDRLHRPIDQITAPAGAVIYSSGASARMLYTLRSGLVKLTQFLPDGGQRIVRLHRKSDLLGLEALIETEYAHTAVALQPTELCRLPVDTVRELSQQNSTLFHELMARWSRALASADRWITEFSTGSARARVARLLLWLAEFEAGGPIELFTREDLGALLGLTTETASRTMAELKRQGAIREPRTNQFVIDAAELRRMVDL